MPDYSIFGGCFRTDLPFPDLRPHPGGPPDWTLRRVTAPPLVGRPTLIGEDRVVPGAVHIRFYRLPSGFRLVYNDTGSFDIPAAASEIAWCPGPHADEDAARLDVIGYGFAVLFHAAGTLCLHGSGVELGSGGVAFIAPKLHGKSTLAHALTRSGARLVTDDALPVDLAGRPMLRPGIHQLRLRNDSLARLPAEDGSRRAAEGGSRRAVDNGPRRAAAGGFAAPDVEHEEDPPVSGRGGGVPQTHGPGRKRVLTDISEDRMATRPIRLEAVYLLSPVEPDRARPAAEREPLSPTEAALVLVRHTKAGCLLGKSESAVVLERAVDLAARTPVHRLRLTRDFDRLDEAVERIIEWHGGPV